MQYDKTSPATAGRMKIARRFTIGVSQLDSTLQYINNQERHHSKVRFEDEIAKILEKHGLKDFG